MKIVPSVTVARFEQLSPGDLFIYPHGEGSWVAMKVEDPTRDGDKLMLVIGPTFPAGLSWPSLVQAPTATVISFGKEYILRLPSEASGWMAGSPAPDKCCIGVTEKGAYARASFRPAQSGFQACYVDMATGMIEARGTGRSLSFALPPGILTFAVAWELLTSEKEPRVILACPW
jgi:hypothetical protein